MTIAITSTVPPAESRLSEWYFGAHLLDSFAAHVPIGLNCGIREMAEAVLGRPEFWVQGLLFVRDGVVRFLGLQTIGDLREANPVGDRIDFFPILSAHSTEIIVGEDDKHLDFRISVLEIKMPDGGRQLVITTAVRCHNRLGHAYLAVIRPFHRLIIHSRLRRAVKSAFAVASSPRWT
ncbi:DUF2867 domain-containing protein [Sphingobium sp. HWE2-09]|uniref:DUF2867 domain-containing protein n=1 Tax=Sphingobium sp. HWE2-09 TaxID=3108390 RepID=UPI002DCEBDDB|nr:DUF2867 domain-containing protein [Sphingobium sp. HWE2-09]